MTHAEPGTVLTRHAQVRQQQRAIPQAVVDGLLQFGECRPAGRGADSFYFTKPSWRRFQAYLGSTAAAFERYRDVYVIAADGVVVTTAYRH